MTTRREFITLIGGAAAAWPLAARAQQRVKIGVLDAGLGAAFTVPFMRKLGELGYVDGKNVVIEHKSAQGNTERLNEFATEFAREQVDIIVTARTPAGFAAKKATTTIPIVLGAISDPVGVGLVASLARQRNWQLAHGARPEYQTSGCPSHALTRTYPLCHPVGFVESRHG